jgi:hypothetical protein
MTVRPARSARRPALAATGCAVVAAAALVAAPATAGAARPTAHEHHSSGPTVVADGLNAPRSLSFAHNGALYVAEAGSGGPAGEDCITSPTGPVCFGRTGSVTRIKHHSQRRVLEHLPSLAGEGGAEPLGPSDIVVDRHGRFVLSIGAGVEAGARAKLGRAGRMLGTWVTGRVGKHRMRVLADLAAFEARTNLDHSPGTDSDPTGITLTRHGVVGTDSGANTLLRGKLRHHHRHGHHGAKRAHLHALAVFGTPDGSPQAVPTSVVAGPHHALYVSQLTGFPFVENSAKIFRLKPGHRPTVYATGLTNVTDLAWSHGRLYAVQLASKGLLDPTTGFPAPSGPVGSLVRVHRGDNSTEDTVAGDLPSPYGVAIRHGHAYVSTCTLCGVGKGQVMRVSLR